MVSTGGLVRGKWSSIVFPSEMKGIAYSSYICVNGMMLLVV